MMAEMGIENAAGGHSTSFPKEQGSKEVKFEVFEKLLWPVSSEEGQKPTSMEGKGDIANLFEKMTLEYPGDNEMVLESKSPSMIKIGEPYNILSLLSCNGKLKYLDRNYREKPSDSKKRIHGERVEIEQKLFKDKYIMVCCFHAPFFRENSRSITIQNLVNICSELYKRSDFEMVVVAKMKNTSDSHLVFNHFLSGFPGSCLVVPFEESKCRDSICKTLELECSSIRCLVVDRDDDRKVLLYKFPTFVHSYGAEYFPFTDGFAEEDEPRWKPVSAKSVYRLLDCKPTDVVYKTNSAGRGRESMLMSELNNTVVGLYLCAEGDCIDIINEMYDQCRTQRLGFEIVVFYIPFLDCVDPLEYQRRINSLLHAKNISWWCWPFDNNLALRLWRLFHWPVSDKLVILEPGGTVVDPCGIKIMEMFKMEAYPFTREALFQNYLRKTRALTLDSFLVYRSRNYVLRGDEKILVETLKGKNILVYLGSVYDYAFHDELSNWYEVIKQKDPNFEVVFVRRDKFTTCGYDENDKIYGEPDSLLPKEYPWLVCPFDPEHSASVVKEIHTPFGYGTLVEFRADGGISSLEAQDLLTAHGPEAFPFDDNLEQEVFSYLEGMTAFMIDL